MFLGLVFVAVTVLAVATRERGTNDVQVMRVTLPARLADKGLTLGEPVFIRVFKQDSSLEVWMKNRAGWQLFRSYAICRWSGNLGPKLMTGDHQAPEGFYTVTERQLNPNSRRYLAFNLGFPNAYDRSHGRTGAFLMIHGGCTSVGCYAMTDRNVDDIYRLVAAALANGQPSVSVHAFPFRMTEANLALHAQSKWAPFWRELKTGYDRFEETREVPMASVVNGHYVFSPRMAEDVIRYYRNS